MEELFDITGAVMTAFFPANSLTLRLGSIAEIELQASSVQAYRHLTSSILYQQFTHQ